MNIVRDLMVITNRDLSETIYFYTFHKCASTLFSGYILKNIKGLQHVDYASQIYSGWKPVNEKLIFEDRRFVYGPIRLSADPASPVYKMLITPTSKNAFIRDKIALFFVRDPRDILVSAYYSLGYTHGLSPVKEIRVGQENCRNTVQTKSLDEYVLDLAGEQIRNFDTLYKLASACERSVILKYEDMVNNYESFIVLLTKYISIDKNVTREIYHRSRPKKTEDTLSHRRSGLVQGFRTKLKTRTIESLNSRLENTLDIFEYEA